ncbi:hypothetical protein D3C86_1225560 [compost metagenome]
MADPLGLEDVEGAPDARGAGGLTGVGHHGHPRLAAETEGLLEPLGRELGLGPADAETHDAPVLDPHHLLGDPHAELGAHLARDVGDELHPHAQVTGGFLAGLGDRIHDRAEVRVLLDEVAGREEGLAVLDVEARLVSEELLGHQVEVLGSPEALADGGVDVDEVEEVAEAIEIPDPFEVVSGQGDPVALGELEEGLGADGAFEVDVEFGFGEAPGVFGHAFFLSFTEPRLCGSRLTDDSSVIGRQMEDAAPKTRKAKGEPRGSPFAGFVRNPWLSP